MGGIPGFFEVNAPAFWGSNVSLGVDQAGFYSTAPLRKTLGELVDFSLINSHATRLTVGAAHVRTSMMRYFDSRDVPLGAEHIMASGALPPAFPAVRIDGELYWDGGFLSNTRAEVIFEDIPGRNVFEDHLGRRVRENSAVPVKLAIDAHSRKCRRQRTRRHDVFGAKRNVAAIEIPHHAGTHMRGADGQPRRMAVDQREVDELAERL